MNDFIMRDRKSHTPTTVRYTDVVKFERNNGHSTAKWVGIGVAAGVGGFLIISVRHTSTSGLVQTAKTRGQGAEESGRP
jgi:hypothetical protein